MKKAGKISKRKWLVLGATHALVLAGGLLFGFMAGVYALPIIVAEPSAPMAEVQAARSGTQFRAEFRRGLQGQDAFHWAEGKVTLSARYITFEGEIAPGPDYKLYLSPKFVETEAEFFKVKNASARIGSVKNYDRFVLPIPEGVRAEQYTSVVIWCEKFKEFIGAARYRVEP